MYKDIAPLDRKLIKVGEQVKKVLVFHDFSVSWLGVIIYLMIEDKTGKK